MMESEKAVSLVQTQLDSYNKQDLQAFASCFHTEVEVRRLEKNEIVVKGLDNFKELYLNLFQRYPNQNCQIKSRIVLNNFVIDEEVITGRGTSPDVSHVVAIYGFRDELIDRVWFAS